MYVHETAIIDEPCDIGNGTKIWHFTHVSSGAKIGKDCILGQNVYIATNTVIGNKVSIQNNVSVYDNVIIENDVFCGPSMVFTNVINPRSFISRKHEYKRTLVKRGASIGANATIICGVTLGMYCFIGAGAVISKDIPDFALVVGVPGKVVGWVSRAGIRLDLPVAGEGTAVCPETKEIYKIQNNLVTIVSNQ